MKHETGQNADVQKPKNYYPFTSNLQAQIPTQNLSVSTDLKNCINYLKLLNCTKMA